MTHRILVVDDESDITALVAYHLAKAGFRVSTASNGPDALKSAREERPDIVILDLMLPGVSGYDVLAELRRKEETRDVGVILLTARREETDRIRGLSLGADDYLTKPFSFPVLVARVRALLRRVGGGNPPSVAVGDLRIDPGARRVWRGATEIPLTAREFDVLEHLMRRSGQVLSKDEILAGVWDFEFDGSANIVEVYIGRLRRKVDEPFGCNSITTVRGAGYRLAES